MDYKLVLDVIVAALLVVTIVYLWMVSQRFSQLRNNRDDLAKVVTAFNDATLRAEAGIPKLRKAAEETGQALQEKVDRAQSLRDDLAFMIERADAMADRLEQAVRAAREEVRTGQPAVAPAPRPSPVRSAPAAAAAPVTPPPVMPTAAPSASKFDPEIEDDRSEAERELLRALQSVR